MNFRGWLPLILVFTASPAAADAEKTLAGRWSASTARTTWSIESWGDACGPRPGSESEPGGVVSVSMQGKELRIDGLGRSYSTNSCWESIPGQRITSHGASARAWRTICQSATGDPRLVSITTTLNASDDRIDFEEAGRYEFTIEGQSCRAARRRVRSYSLVEREGEAKPPEPPPTIAPGPVAIEKPPAEHPPTNCASPGPPSRLEVSPSRKLLRAGDEFAFRVRVLDRSGCPLDQPISWKLSQPTAGIDVSPAGVIHVAKEAGEGPSTLVAISQDRSVQVTVDVVSEQRYRELLSAGTFDDHGETQEVAVATITSADVGTKAAVLEEQARGRRLAFVAVIGVLALGLGAAALWLSLGRRQKQVIPPSSPEQEFPNSVSLHEPLICPTCREEYPAGTKFCAVDANRLVPLAGGDALNQERLAGEDFSGQGGICPICGQGFDPGVAVCPIHDEELQPPGAIAARQRVPNPAPRRICPICGAIYESDHQFCGNDGAALVPIN